MRTFIAVELPEEVKTRVAEVSAGLSKTGADVKWVELQNLHLTLKFLGEVGQEKIEAVFEKTQHAAAGTKAFQLALESTGCFPNPKRPRVIWIGLSAGKTELVQLAARLENEMASLGFPREDRPFAGHLTIGRVRSPKNLDRLLAAMNGTAFSHSGVTVDHVVVMKSDLTPRGPVYSRLKTITLEP